MTLASTEPTLAQRLFIVPEAHFRVDALRFQLEMYELFHRTTIGRLGHAAGTPLALVGWFALAFGVHTALGIALVLAVGGGMVGNISRFDRLVALLTALETGLLAALALGVVHGAPSLACWVGAGLVLAGTAMQTLSHLAEDIPPPQSGQPGFVRAGDWFRALTLREAVRSTVMTMVVFFWLEAWAGLRILPLQLLHLAMRLGHRPELRRSLDARLEEIVSGADPRWREAS